jgi:ketosteroid isomerase-like protein
MNALAAWHAVVRDRNPQALDALLADDVVFHSPVMHRPLIGKAVTRQYLMAAMQTIANPSFRYVREVVSGDSAVLEFDSEIDGTTINGVDMLRFADGLIVEFKVMLRPARALQVVQAAMAAQLS